jgi:hypothetical protein
MPRRTRPRARPCSSSTVRGAIGAGGGPGRHDDGGGPLAGPSPGPPAASSDPPARPIARSDFKLTGQGLTAGAEAAPLPRAGAPKILFQPRPEPQPAPDAAAAPSGAPHSPRAGGGGGGGGGGALPADAAVAAAIAAPAGAFSPLAPVLPLALLGEIQPAAEEGAAAGPPPLPPLARPPFAAGEGGGNSGGDGAAAQEPAASGSEAPDAAQTAPGGPAAGSSPSSGATPVLEWLGAAAARVGDRCRAAALAVARALAAALLWALRAALALAAGPLLLAFGGWYRHNRWARTAGLALDGRCIPAPGRSTAAPDQKRALANTAPRTRHVCACAAHPATRRAKERARALLARPVSRARLEDLLGALPAWLAGMGGATERLDWLNRLLADVSGARLCALVKKGGARSLQGQLLAAWLLQPLAAAPSTSPPPLLHNLLPARRPPPPHPLLTPR